jgi:glucose/arabinose dehydrogenase
VPVGAPCNICEPVDPYAAMLRMNADGTGREIFARGIRNSVGMHFGYPYCHGGEIVDPEFGARRKCAEFEPPAHKLGPHVAGLSMRFYTGIMFPTEYRNQIFIAEHGSWNRSKKIGYRIAMVRVKDGKAVGYESFASGWLQGE